MPSPAAPAPIADIDARVPNPDAPSLNAAPVFILYASGNRTTARWLAERLGDSDEAVWLDQRSIAGCASWNAAIVDGIKRSRAVAVLVSPAEMQSRNVRQELRLTLQYDRPVLSLETVYPAGMEYVLAGRQRVELFEQAEAQWLPRVLHGLALLGTGTLT